MTYDELIAVYPFVDLFLELFKGLAPTIVAVLAIIINNSIAVKRDKRASVLSKNKKINEGKIAILNEMLNKHIELSQLRSRIEDCLIALKDASDIDENIKKSNDFENYIYQLKSKLLEINAYNFSMIQRYDFNVDVYKTTDEAEKYMSEVATIYEKCCELFTIADAEKRQAVLSNVEERINNLDKISKMWIANMIYMGDEIKKLYEQ